MTSTLNCGLPFANEALIAQPTSGDCGGCGSIEAQCIKTYAYSMPTAGSPGAVSHNYPGGGGGLLAVPCAIFIEVLD